MHPTRSRKNSKTMDINQVQGIVKRLEQITPKKVESLLRDEILENGPEIVQLVRERWKRGLRPDGTIIGEYADYGYELFKRQQNPLAGGNVDLILTGALNEDLVVNYLGNALFSIFSDDEKAVLIAGKYGLDVYGVTKEEETEIVTEAGGRVYIKLFEFVGL